MSISHPSLAHQLEAFRASFLPRLPLAERRNIETTNETLRLALRDRAVPRVGDPAPDFALPDQHGVMVRLSERLAHGPVILLFIRGGWCPFCTLTLRAYQACLPAIQDAGGDVLAITPQPASTCCAMAERDLLAFETLSDHGNKVAAAYGIDFALDPLLRPMYQRLGHDPSRVNGTGDWTLPLPATFVVGPDGHVVLAHVEPALHLRLEPADALAALAKIGADAPV